MPVSLKDFFARYLGGHPIFRHFRRIFLLESAGSLRVNREAPPELAQSLLAAAREDPDALLERLATRRTGLSEDEAEAIRETSGWNEVGLEKPMSAWRHLWISYRNPFNVLLTLLAAMQGFFTGEWDAAAIIGVMVVFSTLLRFLQETKAGREADALKAMVRSTATVFRPPMPPEAEPDGNGADAAASPAPGDRSAGPRRVEEPLRNLVPGDIVHLSAGDMIPADCRALSAKDLFVSQSAMTGESLPVEKFARKAPAAAGSPLDLDNLLFMGTNVVSGSAAAVVVGTGRKTYFGALAERVVADDRANTSFHAGVNQVSWLLIRFMLVMAPLVFLLNGLTKHQWMESLLFALSIAVGLTPEMLPMIVTATLAKGAVFLSRKKVIVKRLDAIQNFGAMDVLCTDKTGTLTRDKIVLAHHLDFWGSESDDVLEMAYLNSYYQTGLKNLLDVAVLEYREVAAELRPSANYRPVDEIPFDFERRRMSVVVAGPDGRHILICKGAVEEMLACCTRASHGDADEALTQDLLAHVRLITTDLNEDGMRVVAVAVKEMPPDKRNYGVADERDLDLIGYIAFLDPPKESAEQAIKALHRHGVAVKALTGDNELVARKVCRDVGLDVGEAGVLTGADVEAMDDAALSEAAERATVFARLAPLHKARLVRVMKERGHVVGFMGDGINDAPALRQADIGISVDTGVDIAKEAADIILLEKSLLVLEEGVREGRKTFANMLKYIRMTASSNFGNVFSVLIAAAFLPFLPMLPLHLLVQNLLYDISQTAIPFDHVDDEQVEKPLRWNPADLGRFMAVFGPISSLFDILAFAMMWFVFAANTPEKQSLFHSGWLVVGLVTQTLVVHMIRTKKIPFLQSQAAAPLTAMTLFAMAAGIFLPMGPLAGHLKLAPLPWTYFAYLPLVVIPYMMLTQWVKTWYIRRFGWQ